MAACSLLILEHFSNSRQGISYYSPSYHWYWLGRALSTAPLVSWVREHLRNGTGTCIPLVLVFLGMYCEICVGTVQTSVIAIISMYHFTWTVPGCMLDFQNVDVVRILYVLMNIEAIYTYNYVLSIQKNSLSLVLNIIHLTLWSEPHRSLIVLSPQVSGCHYPVPSCQFVPPCVSVTLSCTLIVSPSMSVFHCSIPSSVSVIILYIKVSVSLFCHPKCQFYHHPIPLKV